MDLLILFKAFIQGLVEGATEFLPISSTGHLIITGDLLHLNDDKAKVFDIVIQLAAILAVCWEYRRKLADTLLHLTSQSKAQHFVSNLLIAFLPAALIGLVFHDKIKEFLFTPITVAIALILGGVAILLIENMPLKHKTVSIDHVSRKQAWQIGFAQSLALIPGVSRSGATILGGMLFGLNRHTATEFSFFLAIPIMFAASGYDLLKNWQLLSAQDLPMFAMGFATAFIAALVAIKFLLRFVASHSFKIFAWYRITLGLIVLWYFQ